MADFEHPFLDKLRALAARLPETAEKISWGHPNFTAGGRMFAAFGVYRGLPRMGIATSLEEQAFLVQDPRFEIAKYVGKQGWVSVRLDLDPEWDLLEELLHSAHARILAKATSKPRATQNRVGQKKAGKKKATKKAPKKSTAAPTKRPTNRR